MLQEAVAAVIIIFSLILLSFAITFLIVPDILTNNVIEKINITLLQAFGNEILIINQYMWLYIPLGIIGVWRWSVWIIKKICSIYYQPIIPKKHNLKKYSIITPVYNEDPKIFKKAILSWLDNKPDEIIAVIDHKELKCKEIFEEFCKTYPNLKLIITDKPGKRPALADGIKEAKSEIVALVDSDTIWGENIRDKILSPFDNPEIGGVTTRQHPIERKTIWQKMTDIFWDMRNYYDLPAQTAMGQSLSCLSGRTSLYRKSIVISKLDEFLNEYILGRKKESGEDKCLTRLVHSQGWKTYYQRNAVIFSYAAHDFKTFWSQRLRWSRNSHNSDLMSLVEGWAWRRPYLTFHMIDRFISIFTLFFGPIFLGISIFLNQYYVTLSILCLWIIGRGIKIIPHLRRHPEDIVLLPLYIIVNFMVAIVKLYALVTIRDQKWIRTSKERISQNSFIKKFKNILLTSEIISSLVIIVIFVLR